MNRKPLRDVSEEEIRRFEEDGAVCVRGMFDQEWIERMRNALDFILANPGSQSANLTAEGTTGRFAYDNYMWTFNADFRAMAFESPIAEIAARILRSSRVNIVFDFILVKEPHTPTPTKWHQDLPANPVEGKQVCGIWVSLDEVTRESGAVEWIRGSHRWGRRFEATVTGDPAKHKYLAGYGGAAVNAPEHYDPQEPMPDVEKNRDRYDIISFDTQPGDFIINSLLTTHGAPGNLTDRRRRAFGYRFAGDDARYAVRSSPKAIKPLLDPKLKHGDPFPRDPSHHIFPQLWPRVGSVKTA